jgi:hypothetical protein
MMKCQKERIVLICLLQSLLAIVSNVAAAGNCAGLTPEQSVRKADLFRKIHAYNGCDQTLDKCLAAKAPHFSVQHLAADVCRLI